LANLRSSQSPLDPRDRTRFNYAGANDFFKRHETGTMPGLTCVLELVSVAIQCESQRGSEARWNEEIHIALIKMALGKSHYAQRLAVKSLYVPTTTCLICWTWTRDADIAFHSEKQPL